MFYKIEKDFVYVGEVLNPKRDPFFLFKLYNCIYWLCKINEKKTIVFNINREKNNRYYKLLIKRGAFALRFDGDNALLRLGIKE
jgi:ssDNA-specific exonuclease RecJ